MKATLVIVTCIALVFGPSCSESPKPMQFNSAKWKISDAAVRRPMSWDLYERNILNGLSRAEVIELLGPPEHGEAAFFAYNTDDSSTLVKLLTWERIHMIVAFDEPSDKVKGVAFVDR